MARAHSGTRSWFFAIVVGQPGCWLRRQLARLNGQDAGQCLGLGVKYRIKQILGLCANLDQNISHFLVVIIIHDLSRDNPGRFGIRKRKPLLIHILQTREFAPCQPQFIPFPFESFQPQFGPFSFAPSQPQFVPFSCAPSQPQFMPFQFSPCHPQFMPFPLRHDRLLGCSNTSPWAPSAPTCWAPPSASVCRSSCSAPR